MVEAYTTTRFRCPTCRKSWAKRSAAEKHRCWHDPANRACRTCAHFAPATKASSWPHHEDSGEPAGCAVDAVALDSQAVGFVLDCQMWEGKNG